MKPFKAYKFTTIGCTSFRDNFLYSPCTTFKYKEKLKIFNSGIHFGTSIMDALECCPDEIDRKKVRLFEVEINGEYISCETKTGFYGCTSSLRFVREIPFDDMLIMLKSEIDNIQKIFSSDKKDVHGWVFNMLYIYSKVFRKPIDFDFLDKTNKFGIGEKIIIQNIMDLKHFNLPWFEWWKEFWKNLSPNDFIQITNMTNNEYFSLITGVKIETTTALRFINTTKEPKKKAAKIKRKKRRKIKKARKGKNVDKKVIE